MERPTPEHQIIATSDLIFIGKRGRRSTDFAYYYTWRKEGQRLITLKRFDGETETYNRNKTRVLVTRFVSEAKLPANQSPVSKLTFRGWTNTIEREYNFN